IPQGEQLGRASVDLGVKKNLWKKKGELILSVSDIFNTFGIRQKIKSEGLAITYENYFETQIIRLGFN
ncbi:MAG: outer membrane beta-barrel protein, partial [Eudoraea sp.]|uniref:outer membrane beta-barrel protein n=1 Tax=Eudoraea sp. TaxID=1979955 RepID=UPI003C7778F2